MILYCDGGNKGDNPSEIVYWSVCVEEKNQCTVVIRDQSNQYHTNNEAEYLAILSSIKYAVHHMKEDNEIKIHSDSQLAVYQIDGKWKSREQRISKLLIKTRKMIDFLEEHDIKVSILWVPIEENVKRLGH